MAFVALAGGKIGDGCFEVLFALLGAVSHHACNFVVGHPGALNALEHADSGRAKEHIALSAQGFRAAAIENGARVNLRRYLKGDPRGKVRLNHAGNHIHAGALGGNDRVDSNGTRELGNPREGGFHIGSGGEHNVGKLVDNQHEVGHALEPQFIHLFVVASKVARGNRGHGFVALFHFAHHPLQGWNYELGFGDDGADEVGQLFIRPKFHALGVDQDEFELVRRKAVGQAHENSIHADRFSAAGGSCNEHVRGGGKVGDAEAAAEPHAEHEGNGGFRLLPSFGTKHKPQVERGGVAIRDFDPYIGLARNRGLNANAFGGEG